MRSLLIVAQMRTDTLCHDHDEGFIGHIEPIGSPNKFIVRIPHKGAIRVGG
jgi:hypothetical protein